MGDGLSSREQRIRELAERLRGIAEGANASVESLESLRAVVAGARLDRVEAYLFDGIVHDARELRGRLTEFLEVIESRITEA